MGFNYNDGGNPKGISDCVARAIAISLKLPYYDVAQALSSLMTEGGINIRDVKFLHYMAALGFKYVDRLTIARRVADMPPDCIVHTAGHYSAVVAGAVNDTIDTRNEMVKGYWVRGRLFNLVREDNSVYNSAPMNFDAALNMRRLSALNYNRYLEIQSI